MKFIAHPNLQTPCFHLAVKRQRQSFWFKSSLQLAPNTRDRGRCSLSLPPLSSLPFKRSDSHENPQRPSVPVLYPALTAAAAAATTALPTHIHTHKHQAFNSYQCALCCFSKVAAAFAPKRWEEGGGEKHLRGKERRKSQSSLSKQLQVFLGIN